MVGISIGDAQLDDDIPRYLKLGISRTNDGAIADHKPDRTKIENASLGDTSPAHSFEDGRPFHKCIRLARRAWYCTKVIKIAM